jgi:F-type H+-transporting ATPase subunit delta
MDDIRVAQRYAASLIRLAIERDTLEVVRRDMDLLGEALAGCRELQVMFRSPVIRPGSKVSVVDAIFDGKAEPLTIAFLRLVIRKRREAVIPGMVQSFLRMYRSHKGIVRAQLETAIEWPKNLISEVEALVGRQTNSTIELTTVVKPELMAGFVIQVEDRRYERSVARSLQEIKQLFSDNHYIKKY